MNKKQKKIAAAGALVLIVIGAGLFYFFTARESVQTVVVEHENLVVSITGPGSVAALSKAEVFPKSAGIIDELFVEDGSQVEEGQVLLKLDEAPLKLKVKEAEAALAQAKASYESAGYQKSARQVGIESAQGALRSAQQGLAQSKSARMQAKAQMDKAQAVFDGLSSSESTLTVETARTNLVLAQAALATAETNVGQSQGAVVQAEAALRQAEAVPVGTGAAAAAEAAINAAQQGLDLANEALQAAVIVAPKAGTVLLGTPPGALMSAANISYTKGSVVSPESAILSIVADELLGFKVEVDESSISTIQLNQKAQIELDAFDGEVLTGTVTNISTSAQGTLTGGNIFMVELTFDEEHSDIRLGMKGEAEVIAQEQKNALVIPISALFSEGADDFVYRVVAGKLVKTAVVVGTQTDEKIEIAQGLSKGDVVALAGEVALGDGLRIRAID